MRKPVQSPLSDDPRPARRGLGQRRAAFALGLGVLVALGVPQGKAWGQDDPRVVESEADLKALRERLEALARQVKRDQARRAASSRAVEKLEQDLIAAQAQVQALDGQLAERQQQVAESEVRQSELALQVQAGRQALARQLRAAYVAGRLPRTRLLLSQTDSAGVGRVEAYFEAYARAHAQGIESARLNLAALAEGVETLRNQTRELDALRNTQLAALDALEAKKADRALAVKRLEEAIQSGGRERETLEAEQRELTALIGSLRDALAGAPADFGELDAPILELRGRLPWPVEGRLLAHFGQAKAGGRLSWSGHWIESAAGAPVIAVARGRVAYVGWLHRYGLLAIVQHDGGYYSLYGHNQSVAVAVGDSVKPGQVIARVGNTGGQDETGLYFELRSGTQAIDPRPWLIRRPSG